MGDDISKVLSEELVKKTNAVYSFKVTDEGTDWYLDLKNGAGSCGQGESPAAVDASFKMSSANFGKMFAGKLKPTAAFMTGRLKIEGNMGKAMKLEKLMGQMQKRGYHTMSSRDVYTVRPNTRSYSTSPTPYTEVAPVFERIKGVASKAFIKKINAVYVFEIEEEGKWHLDLKNGEGSIGQGDPSSKPDVNIILKKETFLKIF